MKHSFLNYSHLNKVSLYNASVLSLSLMRSVSFWCFFHFIRKGQISSLLQTRRHRCTHLELYFTYFTMMNSSICRKNVFFYIIKSSEFLWRWVVSTVKSTVNDYLSFFFFFKEEQLYSDWSTVFFFAVFPLRISSSSRCCITLMWLKKLKLDIFNICCHLNYYLLKARLLAEGLWVNKMS